LRQAVNADVEKTPHHGPYAENKNEKEPRIHRTPTIPWKMFSTLPIWALIFKAYRLLFGITGGFFTNL
jgi:hypothetical protein